MAVNYHDVLIAHERIKPHIHKTPILTNRHINEMLESQLFFKCENFQISGSFKARGAHNAIFSMPEEMVRKGVVTHSSGNHAAAVAIAASKKGVPAYVVMPSNSPAPKKAAVSGYGAYITECEPTLVARESEAAKIIEDTGATLLHPYDNDLVIAGQGTAAKELIEEVGSLDFVTCPVGGGGLLGGTAISVKQLLPNAKLIAAEPLGADDAKQSFESGKILPCKDPKTIADGLRSTVGKRNYDLMQRYVDDVMTVREDSIVRAMKLIWQYMKVIIEPSSAVPLAMLIEHGLTSVKGKKVGIILTGGNVDLDKLPWL